MASRFTDVLPLVRQRLIETTATFWTDSELFNMMFLGARDLWRDIVDLKQDHYIKIDAVNMSLPASTNTSTSPSELPLSNFMVVGVPNDIHKIINIEPTNNQFGGSNYGLMFRPLSFQHETFVFLRTQAPIQPTNDVVYYNLHNPGGPVGAPDIFFAPQVTSKVNLAVAYVPTLGNFDSTGNDIIPIPGEADNAIIAWTVAFARAKERDDRSPDPNWLAVYATEKQHLLQSLGIRQYQELPTADAMFSQYW